MTFLDDNFMEGNSDDSFGELEIYVDELTESISDNEITTEIYEDSYLGSSIYIEEQLEKNTFGTSFNTLDSESITVDTNSYEHIDFQEHGDPTVDQYNPTFGASQSAGHSPHEDSDGYIHKGRTSLDTMGGRTDSFEHYVKGGNEYVKDHNGHYIKISGPGYKVNVNGVEYLK